MKKAVFITNIPAHYRIAMLNSSLEFLSKDDIDLNVIFSRRTYKRRDYWNIDEREFRFKYFFLKGKSSLPFGRSKLLELGFGIKGLLEKINPDLVIFSGYSLLSYKAAKYSMRNSIPFIIYSGETEFNSKHLKFKTFRFAMRKYLIKRAKHFIAYGELAKKYIEGFGVNSEITVAVNSINTESFIGTIKDKNPRKKNNSKVTVLYLGNVTNGKGIDLLLKVAQKFRDNVEFIIAGGGNGLENCKKAAVRYRLENIVFTGKINYSDVHDFYRNSDIFILPSINEAYGLVLIEAACSGLPLLGSKYAGASYEIIEEGQNGFIIDPENTEDIAEKIKFLVESEQTRKEFGLKSIELIQNKVNIRKSGEGFASAIIKCINE